MTRPLAIFVAVLAVLAVAEDAIAQPAIMKPGDAHRRLDFMVGTWTIDSKMYMGDEMHTGRHRTEVRWLPGGVWLEESSEMASTPIGEMFGSARIAWDARTERYVRTWIDNQSHLTFVMHGGFVDESTLEFEGSFDWLDGTTFHHRIVIREEADGWSQAGYMARDPDAMRLNHEGRATRAAPATDPASPPPWFRDHMEYMTRSGGRWVADNAAYRNESERFDAYVVEWRWGIGERSLIGRLHGRTGGEDSPAFWEFRVFWDPAGRRVVVQQFGPSGTVGIGEMHLFERGRVRMEQSFSDPGGAAYRVGHASRELTEDKHETRSFDLAVDGTRKNRRRYEWVREVTGPAVRDP